MIVHQPASDTTTAFEARAANRALTFRAKDADASSLVDLETHSSWNAYGLCLDGRLEGTQLKVLPLLPEFWFAWSEFHPQTAVFTADDQATYGPAQGGSAPPFALADSAGNEVRLKDYRGKVVLLNSWATWCGPCRVEIPWFVELQRRYASNGFAVIGISMDTDWKIVRPVMEQLHAGYRVLMGDDDVAARYGGIEGLPMTLLIDREGRIAARHVGLTAKATDEQEIVELLGR